MNLAHRLHRLEALEEERQVFDTAERLAVEYDVPLEDLLRQIRDTTARIARWGIDAELRLIARDMGRPEEAVRREYEALLAEEGP